MISDAKPRPGETGRKAGIKANLDRLKRSRDKVWVSEATLAKALQAIRDALDSCGWMSSVDIERLHAAEDLLAEELGQPIWELPE